MTREEEEKGSLPFYNKTTISSPTFSITCTIVAFLSLPCDDAAPSNMDTAESTLPTAEEGRAGGRTGRGVVGGAGEGRYKTGEEALGC